VQWHFGTGTKAVDRSGNSDTALKVTLDNGTSLAADIVLSAVGLRPRTGLAKAAGLKINRGIVVNRNLQTSDPDIYALGDCMEIENLVMPFVMPIMHAARALGATLGGKPTAVSFPAMPVLVKTPACPTIVSPPAPGASGEWQIEQTSDGVKSLFVDESGKLLGFALNGTATAERAKLAPQLPPVLAAT
jgi:rubredoxin-NAD+ reductase